MPKPDLLTRTDSPEGEPKDTRVQERASKAGRLFGPAMEPWNLTHYSALFWAGNVGQSGCGKLASMLERF